MHSDKKEMVMKFEDKDRNAHKQQSLHLHVGPSEKNAKKQKKEEIWDDHPSDNDEMYDSHFFGSNEADCGLLDGLF